MRKKSINRLYIPDTLRLESSVILKDDNFHYIRNVLRLLQNDKLRLFNEHSGEFVANITHFGKKEITLSLEKQIKTHSASPQLSVGLCIIKNDKMSDMISMVVQLGATEIVPIISEYVVHRNFNLERFQKIAQEASEQCERLDIPVIKPPVTLQEFIQGNNQKIIYAYEEASSNDILTKEDATYLIGPEGGFSQKDLTLLCNAGAKAVSLGKNILRAETAAASLLSIVQFLRGDN